MEQSGLTEIVNVVELKKGLGSGCEVVNGNEKDGGS